MLATACAAIVALGVSREERVATSS